MMVNKGLGGEIKGMEPRKIEEEEKKDMEFVHYKTKNKIPQKLMLNSST